MSVTIQVGDTKATIQDGRWSCDDPVTLRLLKASMDPGGPAGSDPYPDYTDAQRAARLLRGEIVRYDVLPAGPSDLVI